MAFKLLGLYQKLSHLGHPRFISKNKIQDRRCSRDSLTAFNTQVERVNQLLKDQEANISDLQKKFKWLLYFHTPKLLKLYHIIERKQDFEKKIMQIIREVAFLEVTECVNIIDHAKVNKFY